MNRIKQLDKSIDELNYRLENPKLGISEEETTELQNRLKNAMLERIYLTIRRRLDK